MRLKQGASLENVSWRMFWAALIVEQVLDSFNAETIITAGGDGAHSRMSKHYAHNNKSGMVEALDFRSWHISDPEAAIQKISKLLGPNYDAIYETTPTPHFHVEYDPK